VCRSSCIRPSRGTLGSEAVAVEMGWDGIMGVSSGLQTDKLDKRAQDKTRKTEDPESDCSLRRIGKGPTQTKLL
jgi:hypothetical protein